MNDNTPNFIDITVKEGGLRVHNCWLLDQVDEVAHELESAGIAYAEICHGMGIGGKEAGYPGLHTDQELLEAAQQRTNKLKRIIYIAPYDYSFSRIEALAPYFDIGRVGLNVHEPHEVKKSIDTLKKLGKQVIAQILRVHARSSQDCMITAKKITDWGADVVYLSDSFGSLGTEEVKKYMGAVKNSVSVPLGFQGQNNTGMAVANTLAAWEEGAQWLDGAILGMGPGAGVAPLEELITCFKARGLCEEIRLADLCSSGKFFVKPALRSLPRIQYLDLLMARHRLDYYPQEILEFTSQILDIELENFLKELKTIQKNRIQLLEEDLRTCLKTHALDFDVVMDFLKTGKVS